MVVLLAPWQICYYRSSREITIRMLTVWKASQCLSGYHQLSREPTDINSMRIRSAERVERVTEKQRTPDLEKQHSCTQQG
jgi:hypothetical protein